MNPPMETKASARSPVSSTERVSQGEPELAGDATRLAVEESLPDLRVLLRGASVAAEAPPEEREAAARAALGDLPAPGWDVGQTMATAAPRSTLSRSSVSL